MQRRRFRPAMSVPSPPSMPRTRTPAALLFLVAVLVAGCGDGASSASTELDLADFEDVEAAARGQRVSWWMFGGDDRVNDYVDEFVVPAAAERGVTLEPVPVADTADAVARVLAQRRAGQEDGTVDLIWINGENFAAGIEADLWLSDWARELPNADLVDPDTVDTDFGIPVEGRESPWSRALFVYAHDTQRTPDPPGTFAELLVYARDNPGRVTYPAPPDFTGSAFIRQVVAEMGEDAAFAYLREVDPLLWRDGESYPADEAELNRLFADGVVDVTMSYDPAFVETAVDAGRFGESARPFVLDSGTLGNVSYVTIPADAGSVEGALVVADLLLEPALQATKADPDVLGVPTVLDLDRLDPDAAELFAEATDSPYLLDTYGEVLDELSVDRVEELERRWREEILR